MNEEHMYWVMNHQKWSSPQRICDQYQRIRQRKWYWNMFLVNYAEFSAESTRGMTLPTMYLYCLSLGGDIQLMGILVSVFSIGRMISSLGLGWLCDRWSFRLVFLISTLLFLLGNILYILPSSPGPSSRYLLVFSRFLIGLGAGNRSACRANIATLTNTTQRIKYLTILSFVAFLGYAVTCGVSSITTEFFVSYFQLNPMKFPGFILIVLNIFGLVGFLFFYSDDVTMEDAPPPLHNDSKLFFQIFPTSSKTNLNFFTSPTPTTTTTPTSCGSGSGNVQVTQVVDDTSNGFYFNPDLPLFLLYFGLVMLIGMNFMARGIISLMETINVKLYLSATGYNETSLESTTLVSTFQFYLGLGGLFVYFCLLQFRDVYNELTWITLSFCSMGLGNLVLTIDSNNISFERLAFSAILIWSIGSPIATVMILGSFSKLLGCRPQGTYMGYLVAIGSISRVIFPILPGYFQDNSPIFQFQVFLCGVCIGAAIVYKYFILILSS